MVAFSCFGLFGQMMLATSSWNVRQSSSFTKFAACLIANFSWYVKRTTSEAFPGDSKRNPDNTFDKHFNLLLVLVKSCGYAEE